MRYFAAYSFAFVYCSVAELCESKTSIHYEIAWITGSVILSNSIFLISFSLTFSPSPLPPPLSPSLYGERAHFIKCHQMFHTSWCVRSFVRVYFVRGAFVVFSLCLDSV